MAIQERVEKIIAELRGIIKLIEKEELTEEEMNGTIRAIEEELSLYKDTPDDQK